MWNSKAQSVQSAGWSRRRHPVWCLLVALVLAGGSPARQSVAQDFEVCPVVRDVRVAFPPSTPTIDSCSSGEPSNYVRASAEIPAGELEELHVIGVYEGTLPDGQARGFDEHPQGTVQVALHARPKPIVLFLSSYEPVRWQLTLDAGARLSRVVTQGYYEQTVVGAPPDTLVTQRDPDEVCAYAYGWEMRHNSGGGSFSTMLTSARAATGLTEKSFQGCYGGAAFAVPFSADEPNPYSPPVLPGDEDLAREDVRFPGCEAIQRERGGYCLTTSAGEIDLVGLDSGTMCPVVSTAAASNLFTGASLSWRGEMAYTCGGDGLTRISLVDGSFESLGLPCQAVTDFQGGILLMPSIFDFWANGYRWYESYGSIVADHVDAILPEVQLNSRMTADGGLVLSAWHSTGTIDVADVSRGVAKPPIVLEGYDDWILGLATTADGRLVISGPDWGETIAIFDADSGRHIRDLSLPRAAIGLSCVGGSVAAVRTSPRLPFICGR